MAKLYIFQKADFLWTDKKKIEKVERGKTGNLIRYRACLVSVIYI